MWPFWRARSAENESDDYKLRWVKNLSDKELSKDQLSVLSKGLNFSVTPTKKPVTEVITATETAIREAEIPPSEAEEIRVKVSNILCNSKLPPSNITKKKWEAIKDLNSDDSVVILPADKGRCTVVLNKSDYDSKCQDLLKDTKTYKK